MARLFFALRPDKSTRNQLENVGNNSKVNSKHLVPGKNLHLTLVFLGTVSDVACQEKLIKLAGKIDASKFSLNISISGWWRRPRILWLAPENIPNALSQLVMKITQTALVCKLDIQNRHYNPHITLARKISSPVQVKFEPIIWNIHDFYLIESNTRPEGAEYRIIHSWPLT